jgi:hypothetical protein
VWDGRFAGFWQVNRDQIDSWDEEQSVVLYGVIRRMLCGSHYCVDFFRQEIKPTTGQSSNVCEALGFKAIRKYDVFIMSEEESSEL